MISEMKKNTRVLERLSMIVTGIIHINREREKISKNRTKWKRELE